MQQTFNDMPFNELIASINYAIIGGSFKTKSGLLNSLIQANQTNAMDKNIFDCIIDMYELHKNIENEKLYIKQMQMPLSKNQKIHLVNLTFDKKYIAPFDYLVILTIAQKHYNYAKSIIEKQFIKRNIVLNDVLEESNHTIADFESIINDANL